MKFWKPTLLTVVTFFSIATTVVYTACEKDTCKDLTCENGGSCAEGFCRCATGYEGTQCEIKSADKFVGSFRGNTVCDQASVLDTVDIFMREEPVSVGIVQRSKASDTIYGTINGNTIKVATDESNNYRKDVNVNLSGDAINIFIQEVTDVNAGTKTICTFTGVINRDTTTTL